MRFRILLALIVVISIMNSTMTSSNPEGIEYTNVSPEQVKNALETEDLFLLDVRSDSEYESGHILGAYLIPHTEIENRKNELPENLSLPIIVYCALGGRSVVAAETLTKLGHIDVRNMEGGFSAWTFEVETGSFILPQSSGTPQSSVDGFSIVTLLMVIPLVLFLLRRKKK